MATLTLVKDRVRVTRVQTVKMNDYIIKKTQGTASVTSMETESDDTIFGLDDDLGASSTDTASDNWDMTEEGVDNEYRGGSNAVQFANLLSANNPKVVNLGLTVPMGYTYFQIVDRVDPKKIGKKKFNAELKSSLSAVYGREIGDEQLRYQLRNNNSLLTASIDAPIPMLQLVDEAVPLYKGNVNVRDIVPEEVLLMGLVRSNYEVLDHQYTCIVHVDDNNSRIIFMHGKEFHSMLPEINEGAKSQKVNRTVFSKILFEVDRGKIPTLDRVIISGSSSAGSLVTYLSEQFLDVEIESFQFSAEKLEVLETVASEYKNYTMAIAAAWSALDSAKQTYIPISFIPKYVQTRQQVFKLSWHGYILLGLIAITPAVLNFYYQSKHGVIQKNEMRLDQLNQQIEQVRVVANEVDRLAAEYTMYEQQVAILDTLSYNTLKWSRSLGILQNATQAITGYWITTVQANDENLIIQGTSLYRDRIPQLSNQFDTAIIQQVTERDYRGIIVYDFTLLVTRIVSDYKFFKPQMAELPEDLMRLQEVSTTGTIENQ